MAEQNRNSSHRGMAPLPAIMEEETMMSPTYHNPLQRTPGSMFVQSLSDEDDDILNTNSNRHSELNNNSDDSGGSDGEREKTKALYGPKNIDMGDVKPTAQLEEIPDGEEPDLKAPTWDTMLTQLNKMPGDAILLVADVRAVMLAQSHWNIPYPQALGHVLLAWQMLRSGCYMKDCRVWLRKRYKHKPFTPRQQPFKSMFGIAGFCIRRRRSAPEKDDLAMDQREERLKNNIIEYTAYSGMKGKRFVRRINSKKDEKTERYKGKQWEELDKIILRWDNTGYHTSGNVQVNLDQELENTSRDLRRHASLPSNGHRRTNESEETTIFTVADCLKPGQKNFPVPPSKRIKRHSSDSSLCPGKASQMWMGYNTQHSSEVPADKTSSEDLTKEELWNRAMAEVNCQNLTSSNNSEEKDKEEERAPSPAASLASAEWSVGSQQSSESCDPNCNCGQCGRPLTNSPGYYSTDQNNPASDESIPEAIETTEVVDDLLNRSPFNLNVKGTPTRLEHKMQSSLTLADPLSQGQFVADSGFVNVNDLEVKSCSGDSMDEFVSVKASPCSNASEGFAPTEADILCAKNDRVDM